MITFKQLIYSIRDEAMKIKQKMKKHIISEHTENRFQRFIRICQDEQPRKGYFRLFVLLPVLLVLTTESLASHSPIGGFQFLFLHPYAFFANALMAATAISVALLFRRRAGWAFVISFVWLFLSVVNCIVLFFRVTPFGGSDLLLINDGADIIGKYLNIFGIIGIMILAVLVLAVAVILFWQVPPAAKVPSRFRSVAVIVSLYLLTWGYIAAGTTTGALESEFHELSQSYKRNGFMYCFFNSVIDVGVSKPKDYSEESIKELAEAETESPQTVYATYKPNVIVVQLESFFDVNRLRDIHFSENPVPNLTKYMNICPSGFFNVPVVGAGTVNSEFEVLTGMNIDDYGVGEYPYKTILKQKTCETMAYDLAPYGYTCHAIHNNTGDFYERNAVYRNMGFDTFTSVEYMWPDGYTAMDWAKDSTLLGEIEKTLDDSMGADFVFAVSVQGHGSYPTESDVEYEKHITLRSDTITDEGYLNQLTYYVNQLYEMDQFIGDLIQMLKCRNDNSILVMYGDHLPSLDLSPEDLNAGDIYETEYFIWNNANLEFETDPSLEAYELSSRILKALGVYDGVINSYHQNSGQLVKDGELSEEDYLAGLKALEYDALYGDSISTDGENPYKPKDLQMGISPITITDVTVTKDHVMSVSGENFTRYSRVSIDGNSMETLYLNPNLLVVPDAAPEKGAEIIVSQAALSQTEPYYYQ